VGHGSGARLARGGSCSPSSARGRKARDGVDRRTTGPTAAELRCGSPEELRDFGLAPRGLWDIERRDRACPSPALARVARLARHYEDVVLREAVCAKKKKKKRAASKRRRPRASHGGGFAAPPLLRADSGSGPPSDAGEATAPLGGGGSSTASWDLSPTG